MWMKHTKWQYRCLAYLNQFFTGYALMAWTGFFLFLGVFYNEWKPLISYIVGIIPAMVICFHVNRSQQLWDLTPFTKFLLAKTTLSYKLRTLFLQLVMTIITFKEYKSNDGKKQVSATNGWAVDNVQHDSMSPSPSPSLPTSSSWLDDTSQRIKPKQRNRLDSSKSSDDQSPHTSDSHVPYCEVINCEIEKFVNLITRDYVQSWYKVVCSDSTIVVDIHDEILEILLELCRRARTVNRLSACTGAITMCREHLMKYQTSFATYKIQMCYAMSSDKLSQKKKLPGSVEDVFDQKYSLHPASKGTEASFDHVRALIELLIDCLDILPADFKNVDSLKKILIEIFTLQIIMPLIDMFQDPDFLHESIIMLLSKEQEELVEIRKTDEETASKETPPPPPPPPLPLPPVIVQGSTPEKQDVTIVEAIRPNSIQLEQKASSFDEPKTLLNPEQVLSNQQQVETQESQQQSRLTTPEIQESQTQTPEQQSHLQPTPIPQQQQQKQENSCMQNSLEINGNNLKSGEEKPATGDSTFENVFSFRSREGSRISLGGLPFLFGGDRQFFGSGSDSRKASMSDNESVTDQPSFSNNNSKRSSCSANEDVDAHDNNEDNESTDFSKSFSVAKPADQKDSLENEKVSGECVNKESNCDNKSDHGFIRRLEQRNSFYSLPLSDKTPGSEKESNQSAFEFGLDEHHVSSASSKEQKLNGMRSKSSDSSPSGMRNTFERSPFQTLWPNSAIPRLSQTEDSIRTFPFLPGNSETSSKTDSESDDSGPSADKRCLFQNISVVETESHKEPRANKVYTLYEVQYDASYVSENGELSTKTGKVKRRFREFCTLQQKLEERNVYKKCLKDIKGPKGWKHSLFGNMDQENVTQRRKFLDNYLKNLIKKESISNGPELREFLAYEGDAHIAYVRRTREINMPRIDKAFVKTVSGVLDRIATTVLPRSLSQDKTSPSGYSPYRKDSLSPNKPTEEEVKIIEDSDQILVDIDIPNYESWFRVVEANVSKHIESIKCRRDSSTEVTNQSSSPHSPLSTNQSCSSHTPSLTNQSCSSSNLPSVDQTFSSNSLHMTNTSSSLHGFSMTIDSCSSSNLPLTNENNSSLHTSSDTKATENNTDPFRAHITDQETDPLNSVRVEMKDNLILTSAILDFAVQALQGCDSWLNKEAAYETFAIVSGTVLNNWLQKKLHEATSQTQCRYYLQLLREKLWPNTKAECKTTPVKTPAEMEATKEKAKQYIFDLFPCLLVLFIGEENVQHAISQLIAAIQCQRLNRHFLFCLLDTIFLHLFPEVKSTDFQQTYEPNNVGSSFSSDDFTLSSLNS
ncbi:uncharacterized protein LOC115223689 [Octopus sinensis]|uniref:Uncharacterized protein LOC115223689 n=1 Tax=Octopus sinensis TaxID=2607531 RepID=A0A6P7TKM1_9MOLL|nr:uncharacterized protein LOC115223689 [Octopus sinensis]